MGKDFQGTTPNRGEHNLRLVYQSTCAFINTTESEFNMQALTAGSGSNLFAWLFLIKCNLNSDLHLKK